MQMWDNEDFDQLAQEALRCDKLLKNTRKRAHDNSHIVKVFTWLMMLGKGLSCT